jgi:HTH-type transcriptional regulator/antitoxin HigA
MAVFRFADKLEIHPAIVAGRIRHEEKNYRLLSQFVGSGEIRSQFRDSARGRGREQP